jgi:hypothetical protein
MKINRNTLLASVATLALIAGSGLASAQEQQKGPKAAPQASQPHAAQSQPHAAQPQPHAAQSQPHAAQPQRANRTAPGRAAQQTTKDNGRVGPAGTQPGARTTDRQAQQKVNRGSKTDNAGRSAQEQRIPRGLQGNAQGQTQGERAQGSNVTLSDQQRTRIRQTVIDARGAPRVGHVDFDVRVGTAIPRGRIHIIPVPDTLVQIDPGWRGFLYFVYEDEVVIVDPSDMQIVAILPV